MKVFSFFKKVIIILVCLSILIVCGCFLCVRSYSRFDQAAQVTCLENYFSASTIVYSDVTPNTEAIQQIHVFISSLPDNVSNVFFKDWKIIISPNPPQALNLPSTDQSSEMASDPSAVNLSTLGYSDWHLRLIYIMAQPDPDITFRVFVHELGHCFDYEFGTPSSTDEFQQIYNQYKDAFIEADSLDIASYANSSPEEFFATVFKEYFLYPSHLKQYAPDAYTYFNDLFTEVSYNDAASTTVKYDLQSALLILKKKISR